MTGAKRPQVLVVDDHPEILERIVAVLSEVCEIAGTASTGRAALAAAAALKPDVVVLDLSLPDMTGLTIASRLRQTGSRARIVFLSAYEPDEEIRQATTAAGGSAYVVKFRLHDLVSAVLEPPTD